MQVFINQIADQCKIARHHPEWANVGTTKLVEVSRSRPLISWLSVKTGLQQSRDPLDYP